MQVLDFTSETVMHTELVSVPQVTLALSSLICWDSIFSLFLYFLICNF